MSVRILLVVLVIAPCILAPDGAAGKRERIRLAGGARMLKPSLLTHQIRPGGWDEFTLGQSSALMTYKRGPTDCEFAMHIRFLDRFGSSGRMIASPAWVPSGWHPQVAVFNDGWLACADAPEGILIGIVRGDPTEVARLIRRWMVAVIWAPHAPAAGARDLPIAGLDGPVRVPADWRVVQGKVLQRIAVGTPTAGVMVRRLPYRCDLWADQRRLDASPYSWFAPHGVQRLVDGLFAQAYYTAYSSGIEAEYCGRTKLGSRIIRVQSKPGFDPNDLPGALFD